MTDATPTEEKPKGAPGRKPNREKTVLTPEQEKAVQEVAAILAYMICVSHIEAMQHRIYNNDVSRHMIGATLAAFAMPGGDEKSDILREMRAAFADGTAKSHFRDDLSKTLVAATKTAYAELAIRLQEQIALM